MMNIVLWIAQGWLAATFLVAGLLKLAKPKAELERVKGMAYVTERSATEMKLIGLAEVLGALGLVLPWLFGTAPVLTPVAAASLAVIMVGAFATHWRRKEPVAVPTILLLLTVFVTLGRYGIF